MAPQVALRVLRDIRRSNLDDQHLSERLAADLGIALHGQTRGSTLATDQLPVALVGFGPLSGTDKVIDAYRLTKVISVNAEALRRDSLCARIGDTIFVLLPNAEPSGTAWIERLTITTLRLLSNLLGLSIGCAFACPVHTRDEIPVARADIDALLRHATARRDFTAKDVTRERHSIILHELSESATSSLGRLVPQVTVLLQHDLVHHTDFARTLLMHLESFGDVRSAAAALSIHENSHRYRMRKMHVELGVDIDDPELRLVTWLQLREVVKKGAVDHLARRAVVSRTRTSPVSRASEGNHSTRSSSATVTQRTRS